jgi:hypothetical protein
MTNLEIPKPKKRRPQTKGGLPYAQATTTAAARAEISKVLQRYGCESVGFMDDYSKGEVLLAFTHRGRQVQLRASAKGWAQIYLKANPYLKPGRSIYAPRRRQTQQEYQQAALTQGHVAVNSILRDWIKGQMTAVECGILSFEAVFMPYMLMTDGRPLPEHSTELLPKPADEKVVSLPKPA